MKSFLDVIYMVEFGVRSMTVLQEFVEIIRRVSERDGWKQSKNNY